jgi:hypothetical protein
MSCIWRLAAGVAAMLSFGGPALAAEPADLYGACFVRVYDAKHLAAHPGQRVTAIRLQFQGFAGDLLASVSYSLRHGGDFGFSADCHEPIDGGFFCRACTNDSCDAGGESFRILWSGGDEVTLANDRTGVVGENPEGGRDYLQARGEHALFELRRGAADRCGT